MTLKLQKKRKFNYAYYGEIGVLLILFKIGVVKP